VTTALALALLTLIDGALCGFRAAAGRNPRIFLAAYYRRSIVRGATCAAAIVVVFGVAAAAVRALTGTPGWDALLAVADRMLDVYLIYAAVVLAALALYLLGNFDLGVLASVLVLGPLTLVRPVVIAAGAAWAIADAVTVPAGGFAAIAAATMIGFEPLLSLGRAPWRGLEGDRSPRDR
jgi:hypothetical protein